MKEKPHWPGWFYGPDGAAEIFQCREDVPAGWEDHPSKVIARELRGNSAEAQPIEIIEAVKAEMGGETGAETKVSPPSKPKRPYRRKAK